MFMHTEHFDFFNIKLFFIIEMTTDPKKIGPGVWSTIHLKAKIALDAVSKEDFVKEMHFHYHYFPCLNCRKHIQEYMDTHPFQPFMTLIDENGVDVGLFKWSWYFHNAVNKRLGKPYMPWETAYELYHLAEHQIQPCTDCGNNGKVVDKKKIVETYFRQKKL